MKKHDLKIHPKFFDDVAHRRKKFEIRKNDRDFKAGDHLTLKEWDPETQEYTGRSVIVEVPYILESSEYLQPGFVCMSINIISVLRQPQHDVMMMSG